MTTNAGDDEWLLESLLAPPERTSPRPWVLAISGHAAVGKTSLADLVVRRWPGSVRLESECCILDYGERLRRQASGCSIAAHDVALYAHSIRTLLEGKALAVRAYDWQTRARSGEWVEKRLEAHGVLVLDGTVACHPEIAALCDRVVFLKPADYASWLEFAIERDTRERWRTRELSQLENETKYADTARLEIEFDRVITDRVIVEVGHGEPTLWTFRTEIADRRGNAVRGGL